MASKSINIKNFLEETPGELSADRLLWNFPAILGKNRNGRETSWQISASLEAGGEPAEILDEYFDAKKCPKIMIGGQPARAILVVKSSVVGGKIRDVVPTYVSAGKNIGKANATNVWTQALRDAISQHNKHNQGARETVVETAAEDRKLVPPMLATDLENLTSPPVISAESPVYVQRKFNGVRAVSVDLGTKFSCDEPAGNPADVISYSRQKKIYPGYEYLSAEMAPMFAEVRGEFLIDGEFYKHGEILQNISGTSRRKDRDPLSRLEYNVYDCAATTPVTLCKTGRKIDENSTFSERREFLEELWDISAEKCAAARAKFDADENVIPAGSRLDRYMKLVETTKEISMDDVEKKYEQFRREGYEGAMVRLDAKYVPSPNNYHSTVLLKIKPLFDAEYEIVSWSTGKKGKAAAALMIVCKEGSREFPVTPALEIPQRISMAAEMAKIEENGKTHFENHWKGKLLRVYYEELSKDNLPLRATTKMEIKTWD